MADDPRVQALLNELLESQGTPEEVCGSCVELLPAVRARWRQVCRAQADLDDLFPPAADSDASQPDQSAGDALPAVPGYEVEGILGVGGMGVVFRARHLRLNRVVALKMSVAGAYAGRSERERLRREAEAVASLQHPNVVQVYDVGECDGRPYFTMELVEGGTLAQKLGGTPLPAREAAALLAELAGAVGAAHAAGVIHRDLKPANVLLAADGTPKVSDFGLARRAGGEAGLTRTGTAVGTPSYMAPEQARGGPAAAGPAADIYSLGAVLYEVLTGRPPFRAETAVETVHQLLTQDPVSPSRLNRTVPRDLETVCLTCLRKETPSRYASAAALADELGRFLRGEAIAARPQGPAARLARRVRRRPGFAASIAFGVLAAATLVGSGLWIVLDREATAVAARADRAATERAADDDLREMERLMRKSSWPEARAALERARGRVGRRGSAELTGRIDRGALDLDLVARLDAIRIDGNTIQDDSLDFRPSDSEYEEAFRLAGLGRAGVDDPAAVAARLTASPVRPVLVAALDHWAACAFENPGRKKWLLKTAELADPDATGWRARANDPATWQDNEALAGLIDTAPTAYPSLPVLHLIEARMAAAGHSPVPFMRRVQQAYSGDFWVNARLARALHLQEPLEAVRYYQAALAVRPGAAGVRNDLAHALALSGRRDEAVAQYRLVVAQTPIFPAAQGSLAILLSRMERHDEAIEQVRLAHGHGVRRASLSTALGYSLTAKGRHAEGLAALREAVALDPKLLPAQSGLRAGLMRQGQLEEVRAAWQAALAADPPEHNAWYGYAEMCLYLGRGDEYRQARTALLAKFGATTDPGVAERTARACLLLPAEGTELRQAAALADRAAAADRSKYEATYPYFRLVQGLADYRRGRFEKAIAAMRGDASRAYGPSARLILAMGLNRNGQEAEARKTLAGAVLSWDWKADQVKDQDGWIAHALRREAEGLILPNLPAFLAGKHQPRNNDERLASLGACQFEDRTAAAARLYADAFADDPRLADDLAAGHRVKAACVAALAGCGRGTDAAGLPEAERTKWRETSRRWLRADLAAWGKALEGNPSARDRARETVTKWRGTPDLAGLREPIELAKLTRAEGADCSALWAEVEAVLDRCKDDRPQSGRVRMR